MTNSSTEQRQTLEQRYAAAVYHQVQTFANKYPLNSDERSRYGGMAHKLPVLIRTAGLMQALHFASTRKKEEKILLKDLIAVVDPNTTVDAFLATTRTASLAEYMHLTRQVLAVLVWFKRFAQSILDVDASHANDQGGD